MSEIIEVNFKPAGSDTDVELVIKRRDYMACQHQAVVIDEVLRRVFCKACKEVLDPIEVLMYWSRNWQRYYDSVNFLRNEEERRTKELSDLRREEANAKARLRAARAALGTEGPCP